MEAALRLSDELDESSILAMHCELLSRQSGLEVEAGKFRDELVWIGNRDSAGPRGAEFIAPQHGLIHAAMVDIVGFMDRDDVPALVQIAVAPAQFETIHPFVDGNGRTGRALAQALMRNKGLGVRRQSAAWDVLPRLIGQPVVNTKYLKGTLGRSEMTAARALDTLTDRGVLVERTGRARNRIWQHPGILDVLDEYAASVRRPVHTIRS